MRQIGPIAYLSRRSDEFGGHCYYMYMYRTICLVSFYILPDQIKKKVLWDSVCGYPNPSASMCRSGNTFSYCWPIKTDRSITHTRCQTIIRVTINICNVLVKCTSSTGISDVIILYGKENLLGVTLSSRWWITKFQSPMNSWKTRCVLICDKLNPVSKSHF